MSNGGPFSRRQDLQSACCIVVQSHGDWFAVSVAQQQVRDQQRVLLRAYFVEVTLPPFSCTDRLIKTGACQIDGAEGAAGQGCSVPPHLAYDVLEGLRRQVDKALSCGQEDGLTFGSLLAGICHRRMLLWAVQDASGSVKAAMKPKISARPSTASSHHTSSLCCTRDTCASWS